MKQALKTASAILGLTMSPATIAVLCVAEMPINALGLLGMLLGVFLLPAILLNWAIVKK